MAVQGRSVAFAFTSLLLPLFFLHFPQLLLALRTECGITFTGTEQNGSVTFEVEARYYKISDTCGGSPSGDSVAIWASRESGSERWIGVGTSTSGKMCDADMFMGYYNLSDPTEAVLNDRGATQNEKPAVDTDETDVTVKELAMEDGKLVLRFIRPFLPNDPDDAHFSQPLKFMLATGYVYQDTQSSGGEIFYHGVNRQSRATAIDLSACVGCPCVSDLQDGSFEFSNVLKYVPGTVVTFFCDGGYSLVGDSERTCGDDGIWQGTKPECKPLFQSTNCSATGYRELGNEDTKYKVRWGVVYAGLYAFELSLYSNDNNWVGVGMQPPSRASDGMCLANFVTAYLSRDSSVANIEDRFGMLSGRPKIDTDAGINLENNPHNTHHVNVDGKALFFFTLYPSNWTTWNPMDVDPGLAHHFLFASGYVAEDDENPAGTIMYHYSSRMMFDKTGWRDTCAACEPPTLADGYVVNPNQIGHFFLGDQIMFGCNRFFGLDGPATATCEMKADKSGGVWSGERSCKPLSSWSSCNMTGKCSLSDSSPCITARWMYIPSEESLTVEIKRPVEAGKNYWVGFGFNMYDPVMCNADTTIAFFSLNDSTLLVEDGKAANYSRPLVDSDQSQIMRKKGLIEDGQMTVTVTRKLSTADAQDAQDLHNDETTYLLFATGPVASYGDTDGKTMYHGANSWASPVIRATNSECAGCEPLDEIDDAKDIVYSDTLYYNDVEATYECNDTHVLAGSSITTCNASVWSDPAPVCYPPCEEPSALQNGDVDISYPQNSDLIINATLNYTCHDGFERCGPELLTCQDNGLWDHPVFPLCRLFCVTQNVTFNGTQTEINLVYLAAGSKLWLVPEPTQLSIQKLGNNGWENLVVQVRNVPPFSLIEEEVKQYRLEARNAGRVTDAELIASGSTPLSSSNLATSTFTFTRDNKEIHFGFFLNTLAYTHAGADDFTNRTILFMVTDIYGDTSPVLTINVQHIGTNDDPPVIEYNTDGPTLTFTEDDAPVGMLNRWTISDPDHETYEMKSAKCTIEAVPSGSFAPGKETLSIPLPSVCRDSSTVQYDSSTGVLQINGDGTPENYEDCLNNMTYQHVGEVFPSTQRNIRCEISDGIHTAGDAAEILIVNINDAPTIQFPPGATTAKVIYTQYGPAALPFASIVIKDSDSPNLTSANVTASSLLDGVRSTDMDDAIVLPETPSGLMLRQERNGSDYNLWLSGAATIETYQTYIRGIEFVNKESQPFKLQNNDRTINVAISDGEYRAVAETTIKVIPVNDPPILQFDPSADPEDIPSDEAVKRVVVFTEDGPPIAVAPNTTTLRDVDNDDLVELSCTLEGIQDGHHENLIVNETLTEMYSVSPSITQVNLTSSKEVRLLVSGLATIGQYLKMFTSIKYSHTEDELTPGNRTLKCTLKDMQNDTSKMVEITIDVRGRNDEIDLNIPSDTITFKEGQQQGIYVLSSPHRVTATDAEEHNISKIEFCLTSMPPGYIDEKEYLFLIKNVPAGLTFIVDDSLKKMKFTGNIALSNIIDLARRVMYFNQEDEPTLFVNKTTFLRIRRYVVIRICDTGTPPSVTEFTIEVTIETINEHAPVVLYSMMDGDNCLMMKDRSRRSIPKNTPLDFLEAPQLSVRNLNVSAPYIRSGSHMNVTFSEETNQPSIGDLTKILTLHPPELSNSRHFGVWQKGDTLTVVFVGDVPPIPANQVLVSFKSPKGKCIPEVDCDYGICNSDRTTCPVSGSYSTAIKSTLLIPRGNAESGKDNLSVPGASQQLPQQTSLFEWEVCSVAMIVMVVLVALVVIGLRRKK
eukprot:m.161913 g.161913  ORF g.161913 m.161913 type:complete len:1795 (+) comp38824_c0_seq1:194-5578(+)